MSSVDKIYQNNDVQQDLALFIKSKQICSSLNKIRHFDVIDVHYICITPMDSNIGIPLLAFEILLLTQISIIDVLKPDHAWVELFFILQ